MRPETLRVASPLVMAWHGLRDGPRGWSLSRWGVWETLIHYLLLRRGVVPHETPNDSDVRFSGFAALRLRKHLVQSAPKRAKAAVANRRFAPPPVASAHAPTHLSPLGFTPRGAGQSERERAPEAKLQQPASRERSNHGQISSISAHFFVARASS